MLIQPAPPKRKFLSLPNVITRYIHCKRIRKLMEVYHHKNSLLRGDSIIKSIFLIQYFKIQET